MTTLKSFQAEIEQIAHDKHQQAIKDAREAHAAAELAKHHGKLPPRREILPVAETKEEEVSEVSLEVRCVRVMS